MRKMILSIMVSLDGYIEDADKKIDWHNWDGEMEAYMQHFFDSIDLILLGRITYQMMADFWPAPQAEAEDPIIAERMNNLPKIVFSKTLTNAPWGKFDNVLLLNGIIEEEIRLLKQQPGKDMVIFGGADLASSFIALDLIDEFQIFINPIVLGEGTPLFKDIKKPLSVKLLESRLFSYGNVLVRYRI